LSDEDVIAHSTREQSILLTEDKDFGQLAHAAGMAGIVLFRFPAGLRAAMPKSILNLIELTANDLHRTFAVLQPGRTRLIYSSIK
jgi:hypothetical protein